MLRKSIVLGLMILLFLLPGCSKQQEEVDSARLTVYASFYPLYDFTKKIGGEHVNVINLVPAGANVHEWEPGPQTVASLLEADLLIVNGLGMEPWLPKLQDTIAAAVPIVDTSTGITPLYQNHNHQHATASYFKIPDPHIWLDPHYALRQAENIAAALIKLDPQNQDDYRNNLTVFAQKIEELDRYFRESLKKTKRREFVVTHLAFNYLAERYHLKQISLSGLNPQAEPGAAQMAELEDFMREHQIRYIFQDPFTEKRLAQSLAADVNATILTLNPLASLTEEEEAAGEDYFSLMRKNMEALIKALQE
ncbi:MAG: zinc ABC transporter solute-binding protein [Firmicutes bacterium]|mgnify:CR=1 FL=1|nr:zinc ABC transporter solute-binding protein [Bacillota bacterium]